MATNDETTVLNISYVQTTRWGYELEKEQLRDYLPHDDEATRNAVWKELVSQSDTNGEIDLGEDDDEIDETMDCDDTRLYQMIEEARRKVKQEKKKKEKQMKELKALAEKPQTEKGIDAESEIARLKDELAEIKGKVASAMVSLGY